MLIEFSMWHIFWEHLWSLKYGLVLLRYSSSDSVFLWPLPLDQYNCYCENYLRLLVYNFFFSSSCSKRFLISLSILPLISLVSFSSLKRFLIWLIAVQFSSSFSLKRYVVSLIMFSSSRVKLPSLYFAKTKYYTKKTKV